MPTNHKIRTERLFVLPGGLPTWQVVDHPFRLVAVGAAWQLVAVGHHSRRQLDDHDLVGRPFATRAAALTALSAALGK